MDNSFYHTSDKRVDWDYLPNSHIGNFEWQRGSAPIILSLFVRCADLLEPLPGAMLGVARGANLMSTVDRFYLGTTKLLKQASRRFEVGGFEAFGEPRKCGRGRSGCDSTLGQNASIRVKGL
jgi:hypothetical protein